MKVVLLTGGKDTHYVLGLLRQLAARGVRVVLVGNAELAAAEDVANGQVEFHDLVGSLDSDQGPKADVIEGETGLVFRSGGVPRPWQQDTDILYERPL